MSEKSEFEIIASRFEESLFYRSEAGLFTEAEQATFEAMAERLKKARVEAAGNDLPEARKELLLASHALNLKLNERGFRWRALHVWALPSFLYYGLMTCLLVSLQLGAADWVATATLGVIPLQIFFYGFLGGLIRGLWWLIRKVETRAFRPQFLLPYLAGPWMGALLGTFTFVLLRAGLIVMTPASAPGGEEVPSDPTFGTIALVILAGFSWEWVMQAIDRVQHGNGEA